MNRLVSTAAVAALTLLVSLPALPASAAPGTLVAADIDPLPGQVIDLTGDGDDCPLSASGAAGTFTVSLSYTTPAGAKATVVAAGNVDTLGRFTSSVTLPETAVSDGAADVISSTTCAGTTVDSNRVTLAVLAHTGTLTLSTATVPAGGTVTASADACYGGEYVVVYGAQGGDPNTFEDGTSGVPEPDRRFSSTLTIPATQAAGTYDVYALCPGTEYTEKTLAVTAAAVIVVVPAPSASVPSQEAVAEATLGGGFTNDLTTGTTTGGTTSGTTGGTTGGGTTTPVATAPVAVAGEAAFTG